MKNMGDEMYKTIPLNELVIRGPDECGMYVLFHNSEYIGHFNKENMEKIWEVERKCLKLKI